MIRRSLLTAAFILVGSAAMGNSAFAQVAGPSIDVNFTGTVQGICGFGAVTNGNLATNGPSGPTGAFELSSAIPGGSAGQVTVNCNQPANLQVSNPIQTGGPGGNQAGASVSSPNGIRNVGVPIPSLPGGGSGPLFLNPGATPLTVNLGVVPASGNPYLQPGNYTYKVTLTITN